jgi:hypothetical protein
MTNLKIASISTLLACALGTPPVPARSANAPGPTIPFDAVSMTIEVNATDLDAGVILFSDTEERLHHLTIQDPSGNTIYEMTSSDAQGLGLTEMTNETAEPDITTAFLAYPEGDYTFTGEAFDGTIVTSVAHLSHAVPAAPDLTDPEDGDLLSIHHVKVAWELDESVDHYWIELEQEDPPVDFTIQLQPGVHEFKIPASLLRKASSYKVGVGAVGTNGNATVSEVGFDTK